MAPRHGSPHLSNRSDLGHAYFEDIVFEKRVWTASANVSNYALVFTRPWLGTRDKVGRQGLRDLVVTLSESEIIPRFLVLWGRSVRLALEGSSLLPALTQLERAGVRIMVSSQALEALQARNRLRLGRLAGVFDLLEAINKVQKVVSF